MLQPTQLDRLITVGGRAGLGTGEGELLRRPIGIVFKEIVSFLFPLLHRQFDARSDEGRGETRARAQSVASQLLELSLTHTCSGLTHRDAAVVCRARGCVCLVVVVGGCGEWVVWVCANMWCV